MSLVTLARKTRAKQRLRTRGNFILNMTGRGNVLGMNAKMSQGNCKGLTKCAGKRATCCVGVAGSQCCEFPHGGQPAPQMGYGVYLNRKSKGAYHPGGGPQCCTSTESGKIVYKQPANISAGEVVEYKKTSTVACYHQTNNNSSLGSAHCASEGCTGKNTYIELYKYKMLVGSRENGPGDQPEYGYDNVGFPFGCLNNTLLLGYEIQLIDLEASSNYELDLRIAAGNTTNINQCSIKSLTLHDAATNETETYYATNVLRFTSSSSHSKWHWDGRNSFLPSKVGKCINVTIEVEKTKDITKPCLVRKNICGCRATDLVGYVRINHQRCSTTKTLPFNVTAGDQIVRKRGYTLCPKYGGTPNKPQMLGSCSGR